jgi:hypothetical protein
MSVDVFVQPVYCVFEIFVLSLVDIVDDLTVPVERPAGWVQGPMWDDSASQRTLPGTT